MTDHTVAQIQPIPNTRIKDMTGQRFGRLFVVGYTGIRQSAMWLCRCDCGNETIVVGTSLRRGATRSCGCGIGKTTHGMSRSTEYRSWRAMYTRCNNSNSDHYSGYGGRGVTVCERWNSFENFLEDMGHCPSPKHSIDRIDNDGNYEPKNCRWATSLQQMNNRRNNVFWVYQNRTLTISEWAREKEMSVPVLCYRVYKAGWSIERALTTPIKHKSPNKKPYPNRKPSH